MPNPNFDRDKAARVVSDAALLGDRAAASRHGVALRTVRHYRQRLEDDPEFAAVCREKQKLQDAAWADEIPDALAGCINFIKDAAQQLDPKDPKGIEAMAQALETLSDVWFTHQLLQTRLEQELQR